MKFWKVGALAAMTFAAAGLAAVAETSAQSRTVAPTRRALEVVMAGSPRIGVTIEDTDAGVRVEDVDDDMPAAKAGIKTGDLIVEFDGERVRSRAQLSRLIQETPERRKVNVVVTRGGQRMTFSVQPESRGREDLFATVAPLMRDVPFRVTPTPVPPRALRAPDVRVAPRIPDIEIFRDGFAYSIGGGRLGVSTQTLNDQLAKHFGVERGVLVQSVSDDSAASKAGIRAGDVITKVNGNTVEDSADLAREIGRASGDVTIEIVRDRKPQTVKATLEASRPRGIRRSM